VFPALNLCVFPAVLPCCCSASRPPPRFRIGASGRPADPFLPRPEGRIIRGFGPPMGAMPETEGRFPAPGRDVATAATPAVTRNASGVLLEAAATGLAEEAHRGG